MTLEEFLRLSDETPEGQTLELIEGELRARPMTTRRPRHTRAFVQTSRVLANWLEQAAQRGVVDGAEVRVRLCKNPQTIVGIDVAVWLGEEFEDISHDPSQYDVPPAIAIEILSASDTHEMVVEKLDLFLKYGVKQAWIIDADMQTVTVYRPDREPEFFTASQMLTAEPELPGFKVQVRQLLQAHSA